MRVLALLACGAAAVAPDWPAVRARGANASFSFPAFYVGGAAKCGTTTLSAWFAQHPRVLAPRVKEPFFFGKTEASQRRDMPDYFRDLRLESWWNDSSRATFDGTASYLVDKDPHTLYSLRAANPAIKLVVVFREPVTRAVSYLQHAAANVLKRERHGRAPDAKYPTCLLGGSLDACARNGALAAHLERYGAAARRALAVFDRRQFYFATMEALIAAPAAVFGDMLGFLGLEEAPLDFGQYGHSHSSDQPYNLSARAYGDLVHAAGRDADDLDGATGDAAFTAGWRDLWRAQRAQCDSPAFGRAGECYVYMNVATTLSRTALLDMMTARHVQLRVSR